MEVMLVNRLTDREIEILRLLDQGLSNREIGRNLSLSLETVKWYNKRIYDKLGANTRTQATAQARSLGLLGPGSTFRTAVPAVLPKHNLPAAVTSFVGRQQDIGDVTRLLKSARLLTIAGPAGCGKTRLALQVASSLLPHLQDGVCFVPLAPVLEADKLIWAVAERLGVQFAAGDEPHSVLLSFLRERTLLLILDNFEHLLAGVGIVTEILATAPGVKILVTSREQLHLYGEVTYRLGGLLLPAGAHAEDQLRSEAVELFVQRAYAINPGRASIPIDMDSVLRICRLVEGMPLAIELAATWMNVLSPAEIAHEIEASLDILTSERRDAAPGQQSMRTAIARSWTLLDRKQQLAFRRLTIFRGGFTRDAARAVAGAGIQMLHTLAGKSLLQYDQAAGRYQIHDLLNHYGHEQLASSGELEEMKAAHAAYYVEFMAERWPQMKGRRQNQALREIEAEMGNVRTAWQYWIHKRNTPMLTKFLCSFWVIHDIRGWYPTGIELFAQGIDVMRSQPGDDAQFGLNWLLAAQGLYRTVGEIASRAGFALAQESVEILMQLPPQEEMILPLISLFITAVQVSEYTVAAQATQNCLTVACKTGDRWGIAKARQFQAILAIADGDHDRAELLAQEALAIFGEIGDNWSQSAVCIEIMGQAAINLHAFDAARAWIERGLDAAHGTDFRYSQQMAHWQLGYIEALQGNYAAAGRHWLKARALGDRVVGAECFIGFGGMNLGEWGGRKLIPAATGSTKEE